MKCPECQKNQKYKDGMVCRSCGYRFVLDPKIEPYVSDMGLKVAMDHLSGVDGDYFTHRQLYASIYRIIEKKKKPEVIITIVMLFFIFLLSGAVMEILKTGWWLPLICLSLAVMGIALHIKRPVKISPDAIERLIKTYQAQYPSHHLVVKKQFEKVASDDFHREFLKYAPERILIVERNDLVDMLLLNQFHFDNKTLVLSAKKYPAAAFSACRNILSQHPEVPVCLIHDASEKGLRLKKRLLSDETWNLDRHKVQDLGLFPEDVDRLKNPVWMANPTRDRNVIYPTGKTAMKKIAQGFIMPVDVASPRAMMGTLTLAMSLGLVLLSRELISEQFRQSQTSSSASSGGYG
jgi:hypothetical protein